LEEPTASEQERTIGRPAWRRVFIATLVAAGSFLLFYMGAILLPLLTWPGCVVFLPVGVWLGRGSRRPWMEGALYGLFATALVLLLLLLSDFPWAGLSALFLVLPQGVLGTWLGARLFPTWPRPPEKEEGDVPPP